MAPASVPSAAPPPASTAAPPGTRLQDGIRKPKKFNDGMSVMHIQQHLVNLIICKKH
jgi:hypothetical protein